MNPENLPVNILFDQCTRPPKGRVVIDPFAGDGQVIDWLGPGYIIIPYDKDSSYPKVIKHDVIQTKVRYIGMYIVTRPPQLKKTDSEDKELFARHGTDDLYKCFINFLNNDPPQGGIIIVPISFLNGQRDSEIKRRSNFFRFFQPERINVFNTTTVVVQFSKRYSSILNPRNNELWKFNFYDMSIKEPTEEVYNIDPYLPNIPGCNHFEFSLKQEAKKKIHLRYDNKCQINETLTDLAFSTLCETDCIEELQIISAGLNHVVVKGFMSKPLQEKIKRDFNIWHSEFISRTNKLFRKPLTVEVGLEAIRRIIYSYYEPDLK